MGAEGRTFVGCLESNTEAQVATDVEPPKGPSVHDLLGMSKEADVAVVTENHVDTRTGAWFIKATKTTVGKLKAVGKAKVPPPIGKKAPTPDEWDQAQDKPVVPSTAADDPFGNDTSAFSHQYKVAMDTFTAPEPMGNATVPLGGRHHRRMLVSGTDNRWHTGDSTMWPWPAVVKLVSPSLGSCSGTLFSPDDILTAAHCVVNSVTGQNYFPITVIPGKNGALEPYGRWVQNLTRYVLNHGVVH